MVGYGAHTRVPHMSSPLFSWLAYWMEVTLIVLIVLNVLIILIFLVVLILVLITLIVLIILFAGSNQDLQWLMKTLGIHEFLPSSWLMEWLSSEVNCYCHHNLDDSK